HRWVPTLGSLNSLSVDPELALMNASHTWPVAVSSTYTWPAVVAIWNRWTGAAGAAAGCAAAGGWCGHIRPRTMAAATTPAATTAELFMPMMPASARRGMERPHPIGHTSLGSAEHPVQQRGRQEKLQAAKSRDAGPVCCNGWFGLFIYDVRSSPCPLFLFAVPLSEPQ